MNAQARLTIACLVVLAAATGLVSTAQAGWSRPKTVGPAPARRSALAVSPTHGGSVAWAGQTQTMCARRIRPRGGLGPVRLFSGPLTDFEASPRVPLAASGAPLMLWSVWQLDD